MRVPQSSRDASGHRAEREYLAAAHRCLNLAPDDPLLRWCPE
ncbi:hypothetical protein [Streptomyces sp. 2A115]